MNATRYNLLTIFLHWITALAVVGLFALGLWMDGLGYYDAWYQKAPHIHRSIGLLLAGLIILRLIWRQVTTLPAPLDNHKPWERLSAKATHWLLYGLLLLIFVSGYLISTAKGKPIEVFNWFSVPSLISGVDNLEDLSGEIHELAAFSVIGLTLLHAAAALKHHFIDRDRTLLRMFGK